MTGHDVIVVGARVAGAATAMLLARQGVRVLLVDQARFGSDTISSHQVQVPASPGAGCPAGRRCAGRGRGGPRAVPHRGTHLVRWGRHAVFPTNDDLTMVYMAAPLAEFAEFRADIEGNYLATLGTCGDLGERVRARARAERLRTTPDQPNTFRASHGPGWALAGDAGVVMDSITAQGITNALRDAELLARAITDGLGGQRPLAAALADHQRQRDIAIRPMYDFTIRLAGFAPPSLAQRRVLASIAGRPAETDQFLGAFAGIIPVGDYFAPGNMLRILGLRGIIRISAAAACRPITSLLGADGRNADESIRT